MPRRKRVFKKHKIHSDERFNSVLIAKLINNFMIKGKKNVAKKIVYGALKIVGEVTGKKSVDILAMAIKNVTPLLRIKTRRIGAISYQVPVEIENDEGVGIGLKYIVSASREESSKKASSSIKSDSRKYSLEKSLAAIIIDSANNTGKAVGLKQKLHDIAEANKANARYRW